jgi:hypothetical protein
MWYQPHRAVQPAHAVQHRHTVHRSHSSRSSGLRISYGTGYSSAFCPTYGYSTRYSSSRYRSSGPIYHHPSYYRSSRPTVISYPSTSTRITYVNPVVRETQYITQAPSTAYDAVGYREYQRLLAEQRVLRQQVIEMERERAAAAAPTYNPGPPVPSTSPLNLAKEVGDNPVKQDRPRSADEFIPPVPKEQFVRPAGADDSEQGELLPVAWKALADGNFGQSMRLFTDAAGGESASTADRVGFAVAAASVGQRERAAWAMRRVLIADPEGFGFIPSSDELQVTLKRLSSDIGRDAASRADGPERRMLMFLTASLDYLSMDMESAAERLAQAGVDGQDQHAGAANLRRLLEESGSGGF